MNQEGRFKGWYGTDAAKARRHVKAKGYANNEPCYICNQPIDYRVPSTDPDGPTVQHIKPQSLYPHLTWDPTNWAPAHSICNKSAGNRTTVDLGNVSRQWGN